MATAETNRTNNHKLIAWVDEMAGLTKPDNNGAMDQRKNLTGSAPKWLRLVR